MHYKNGREAKPGDPVVHLNGAFSQSGILYGTNAASTTCNGRLAPTSTNDPYISVKDCLHVDDIAAATVPDSRVPQPAPPVT